MSGATKAEADEPSGEGGATKTEADGSFAEGFDPYEGGDDDFKSSVESDRTFPGENIGG